MSEKEYKRKFPFLIFLLPVMLLIAACGVSTVPGEAAGAQPETVIEETERPTESEERIDGAEEVSEFLAEHGRLPNCYITKEEARALGWEGGSVEQVAPGKCIGGDVFGNYEGNLPDKDGRIWYECDIDTLDYKDRGSRRLVFSNDGLIYYSGDHYRHFELLKDLTEDEKWSLR